MILKMWVAKSKDWMGVVMDWGHCVHILVLKVEVNGIWQIMSNERCQSILYHLQIQGCRDFTMVFKVRKGTLGSVRNRTELILDGKGTE